MSPGGEGTLAQAIGATVVLDIGKTNAKLTLIDAAGHTLAEVRTPNTVRRDGPYPHHDTERLWDWLLTQLREFAALAPIRALVPVTHGSRMVRRRPSSTTRAWRCRCPTTNTCPATRATRRATTRCGLRSTKAGRRGCPPG
ncbi:MAG: hypothetical protein JF619_30760 [Massilia sp.]|nr:hypothetical protein [Massilia sp.]